MNVILITAAAVVLVTNRPWRSSDEQWRHESALLAALLAGAMLLTVA
jgi:hypothetical protein